ncbi:MAG: hypothetical protein K9H65_00415 [Bacteroidales bacterium]|nr:hypothetical protein [Bacteroidales bacterium]
MKKLILLFIILFVSSIQIFGQLSLDVETGLAFQEYNDIRIPNDSRTATKFDFNKDFDLQGPVIPYRITVGFTFAEKNHLLALYAPLSLNYEGSAPFDINFQHTLFSRGQFVEGYYKFNSYRLTYRRDVLMTDRWTLGVGFTAKVRDARVQLSTDDVSVKKDDLGFVPLLHVFAAYDFERWSAFLKGDGLAGGPGRAFDFFLGGKVPVTDNLSVKAGYRILEGGADVDEVYSFTLINFASTGIVWNF